MNITIDPGLNCGWAIWDENWNLRSHGVINAPSNELEDELESWTIKAVWVSERIREKCWKNVGQLYIEYPSAFGGGVAVQSGAVVKLATLVGMICGNSGVNYIELVPVTKWKGQLSKEVVRKRIARILEGCKATSHDADAIGIGLYKKGVF